MTAQTATISLTERVFRAGTSFELVLFDRLPPEEQAALAELASDPDFYGILRPRQTTGATIKSVNRDTALLWLTMGTPARLPYYVLSQDPEAVNAGIWQLVLDGVLEMDQDGHFVSGPAAAKLLAGRRALAPRGTLVGKSRAALRQADRLALQDAHELAEWLYRQGTQPLSPRWLARLPDSAAVLEFVGAAPGTELRRRIDARWESVETSTPNGWIAWSSRERAPTNAGDPTYKLYVSPLTDAMPEAFAAVASLAPDRVLGFKIGENAAGLLRPDKMVLYFDSLEKLLAAASELERRLPNVPAHGVPFSSQITADGLLSWGMDPPREERKLSWQDTESWRLWLVRRLALAMCAAGPSPAGMTASEFALERLRHEGVDVDDWKPAARLWRAA